MSAPLTESERALLQQIADAETARACRANIAGPCKEAPVVVVAAEELGLLPFCEEHGDIVAGIYGTITLPIDSYEDDALGRGVVFLYRNPEAR